MEKYFGNIKIGATENTTGGNSSSELISSEFIHYPDCQQLIIRLPQNGWDGYGAIRLLDSDTKKILDERPLTNRLNGNTQVLWDTVEIPPGNYTVEIEHPKGGKHLLHFSKSDKMELPAAYTPVIDEDLLIRDKFLTELFTKMSRRISYEGSFRGGSIIFHEGDLTISFYHEMGGGDCKFYIDIPTAEKWKAQTKTKLSRRDEILQFVAETVKREKASSWQYVIRKDMIYFF